MALGHAIAGGLLGFTVGMIVRNKQRKREAPMCGITEVAKWAASKGLQGIVVTSRFDLALMMPKSRGGNIEDSNFPPEDREVIVTQTECSVFHWQGDVATGNWVEDPGESADLSMYLAKG